MQDLEFAMYALVACILATPVACAIATTVYWKKKGW